ncbi:hypothetical protein RLIN73S_01951 [Rhodanobacter lindaniclasticus]
MRVCATLSVIVPRVEVSRAAIHGCGRGTCGPAAMSPKYFSIFSFATAGVMSPDSTTTVLAAP